MKYITYILIFLLIGCGSRKAELEKIKLELKENREVVLKLRNDIQSNVHLTRIANRTIIEPIDSTKESSFNGTSFKNAKITQEEERTDSTAYLNDQSEKDIKVVDEKETTEESKNKSTDAEKGNPWKWLMWGFIGVVAIVAVLYFRPWK